MRTCLLLLALAIALPGCYSGTEMQHPVLDSPPEGVTYPKSKYTIVVVHGNFDSRDSGLAYERYHADVVQFQDQWVLFHDKTLDTNVRTPAARTTVYGGDDQIFPFIKADR